MGRRVIFTNEQKKMLDEISVVADTASTNGNIGLAVQNAQQNAEREGARNVSVVVPPNESVTYKKSEIQEAALRSKYNGCIRMKKGQILEAYNSGKIELKKEEKKKD